MVAEGIKIGLKENWKQFVLPIIVNAFVARNDWEGVNNFSTVCRVTIRRC